jgi:hypothetical protein
MAGTRSSDTGHTVVLGDMTAEIAPLSSLPRHTRRLSDKILIAFHQACDQEDLEVAEQLLHILELMLARRPSAPDQQRRRSMEGLVAAYERLWYLKHKERVAG